MSKLKTYLTIIAFRLVFLMSFQFPSKRIRFRQTLAVDLAVPVPHPIYPDLFEFVSGKGRYFYYAGIQPFIIDDAFICNCRCFLRRKINIFRAENVQSRFDRNFVISVCWPFARKNPYVLQVVDQNFSDNPGSVVRVYQKWIPTVLLCSLTVVVVNPPLDISAAGCLPAGILAGSASGGNEEIATSPALRDPRNDNMDKCGAHKLSLPLFLGLWVGIVRFISQA